MEGIISVIPHIQSGQVKSTKAYIPYKQVLVEKYSTRSDAMKREKELKKMKSGVKFKELIGSA